MNLRFAGLKRSSVLFPIMRWAVIGLAGAILVVSIVGLVRFPDYAAHHLDQYVPNDRWTGAQVQMALAELGLPPMTAAWFELGRGLFGMLLLYSIAAILWKKSRDGFGLFLMAVFIMVGPVNVATFRPVLEILPGLSVVDKFLGNTSWQYFFILFFFFPTGRPVPAWTGWFVAGYAIFLLAALGFESLNKSPIATFISTGMVVLAIGSQIYRYLRRSDAVERQQTKWVVSLLGFFLLVLPVVFLFGFKAPSPDGLGLALIKDYVFLILASSVFLLTPAAIAIAVLRYRLWDLDILIRRTLLYGALTAILAGLYYGGVLAFGELFRAVTGQDSPLALVLSTLVIAALVTPLRRRIQNFIDRRFYRQKYNADHAVTTFAAAARSEVKLGALAEELTKVAGDSLQPESISLWLKRQGLNQ